MGGRKGMYGLQRGLCFILAVLPILMVVYTRVCELKVFVTTFVDYSKKCRERTKVGCDWLERPHFYSG